MIVDYKVDYVIKFLKCKTIRNKDIAQGSGIALQTIYYLKYDLSRVKRLSAINLNNLFMYFKSLNLDENNLTKVKRTINVVYTQED